MAENGYTLEEAVRETNDPIEQVLGRANRYQIKFKKGSEQR